MRFKCLLVFIFLTLFGKTQISVGYIQKIMLIQQYSTPGQEYLQNNKKLEISSFSTYLNVSRRLNSSFGFSFGLNYQYTNLIVKDVIQGIEYYTSNNQGQTVDSGIVLSNMDYKSISNSFGINFEGFLVRHWFHKTESFIGLNTSFYLYEISNDNYFGGKDYSPILPPGYSSSDISTPINGAFGYRKGFFLSSINLSTYYRHVFQLHEKFSLAARVSIGTNLYSDWDQFKKYAWLGLGLEMGFGKVRELKKKEKPTQ